MPIVKSEVDVIFVHKDPDLGWAISRLIASLDKEAVTYHEPQQFLADVGQYPKETKIILGCQFHDGEPQGIQMAQLLHAMGFKRLYLTSVMNFLDEPIPYYVTFIGLPDLGGMKFVLDE